MKHWVAIIVQKLCGAIATAEAEIVAELASRGTIITDVLPHSPNDSEVLFEQRYYRKSGGPSKEHARMRVRMQDRQLVIETEIVNESVPIETERDLA